MQTYFKHGMGETITLYFELFKNNIGLTGESPVVAIQKMSSNEWLDDTKTIWESGYNEISMTEPSSGSLPGVYALDVTHIDITAETYNIYFSNTGLNAINDFESHSFTGAVYVPPTSNYSTGTVLGNLDIMKNKDGNRTFVQTTDSLEAISDNGLDATNLGDIAGAVWTEPSSGYNTPNTMGYFQVLGGGSDGANLVNIILEDQDSNRVPDAFVKITNDTYSQVLHTGTTNVSGEITAALDDGLYNVLIRKSFFNFEVPESMTVAGSGSFTFAGSGFSPTAPSAPETCTVYGYVIDLSGTPVKNATVKAIETSTERFANSSKVVKVTKSIKTDSSGYFELELIRSSLLVPIGIPYTFTITYPGFSYSVSVIVPDSSTINFNSII